MRLQKLSVWNSVSFLNIFWGKCRFNALPAARIARRPRPCEMQFTRSSGLSILETCYARRFLRLSGASRPGIAIPQVYGVCRFLAAYSIKLSFSVRLSILQQRPHRDDLFPEIRRFLLIRLFERDHGHTLILKLPHNYMIS